MGATFNRGNKIRRMESALSNPKRALRQIGFIMVAQAEEAFRDQAWDGQPWPPRHVPNYFGVIRDFYEGRKEPPKRRWDPRPALRDTGALMRSVTHRIVGPDTVEVGSAKPYSKIQNEGGPIESLPINDRVRANLAAWLKKKRRNKDIQKQFGWLLNKKFRDKTLKSTAPKRQFLGLTKRTIEDIKDIVGVEVFEVDG